MADTQRFTVSIDDVSALIASLPAELQGSGKGLYYDSGVLVVPVASAGIVASAITNLPAARQADLIRYANLRQAAIMSGGTSVAIGGGVSVACSTDTASLALLHGAASLAASAPSTMFSWVPKTGAPVTLTAAQITTMFGAVSTFLQATFTALASVIAAVNAGTITTKASVDAAAWPANS